MSRRAARQDDNQAEIVQALRKAGIAVQDLSATGGGVPDLLCAIGDRMALLEIKDGKKPPSARALTPDQIKWHAAWPTKVHVVLSVDDALRVMGLIQ